MIVILSFPNMVGFEDHNRPLLSVLGNFLRSVFGEEAAPHPPAVALGDNSPYLTAGGVAMRSSEIHTAGQINCDDAMKHSVGA